MKGYGFGRRGSSPFDGRSFTASQSQSAPAVRVVELSRTWLLRSGSSSTFSTDNEPAYVSRSWGPGPEHPNVPRAPFKASITKRDAYMIGPRS
jgi:hypothetical protein